MALDLLNETGVKVVRECHFCDITPRLHRVCINTHTIGLQQVHVVTQRTVRRQYATLTTPLR